MRCATRLGHLLVPLAMLLTSPATSAGACGQPDTWSVAAAFQLTANGASTISAGTGGIEVPSSLLAAIGWVESNWRQFRAENTPLVSGDFGYGVMQVTSGMAGAFGDPTGSIDPGTQSEIASDYAINIAYGARILTQKWESTPRIGTGNPAALEDWYYAVWAYNGWGWVNNPNNPRFSRTGTPATDPASWPYQERVFFLVAHPPRDAQGNPLWQPIHVSLPARKTIGRNPASYAPVHVHLQPPSALAAVYTSSRPRPLPAGKTITVHVRVTNTGSQPWPAIGSNAVALGYHLFTRTGDPWAPFSPYTPGVVAFGQHPVSLPHDILPGQSVTLAEAVHAPPVPGNYRVAWDMEQAPGTWFSEIGVQTRAFPWRIGGSTATPPPPPSATPTLVPDRAENLTYVADTGTPDGTKVGIRSRFQKGWLVFNSGTNEWTTGWRLVRIGGKRMGADSVQVPDTKPCTSANLLVEMRAPTKPGTFKSRWKLEDPEGNRVGDVLTVVIRASTTGGGGPPAPTPTPTRPPAPSPTPTPAG